ncbi:hypothetical protein [Streptomyces mirabilis]|uniref:Uncharacterized protein n=1 Tax=Streptomyces mirabilis TaxID=68239 RepID=A0A1I2N463_9ACTN|nr:hypothetical protein [Streptomyces mirabilis]SFF97639.1 hypothetical protein SAMN02787118_114140 [Streptomyces mirabilis]
MTFTTLFARRPAAPDTATWTADGTTVVQRYRGAFGEREGAIVLVYTADGDRGTPYFAAVRRSCAPGCGACASTAPPAPYVYLSDFHADRVDLQRPPDFIKETMLQVAQTEPDFLAARPDASSTGTQFLIQPHPPRN